jgi:hypothetical protein
VALVQLEEALLKLKKIPPRKRVEILYKLRHSLDEESFRHVAALLAIDMSQVENSKRWASVEDVEEIEERDIYEDSIEIEDIEFEVVPDDEYVGKSLVEKLWKLTT